MPRNACNLMLFFAALMIKKSNLGPKMKIATIGILFFAGLFGLASGQESSPEKTLPSASIGLGIGRRAPAFALRDQFGRAQSNQTLLGANGTVLLFFRSADW
jgi:hypothetical protein